MTKGTQDKQAKIRTKDVCLFYGPKQSLFNISMDIYKNKVTSFIGRSGCGKSSFLRIFNRMNETIDGCRITGKVTIDNYDIYRSDVDVVLLRKRVGMVFQKPVPFPMSIYSNVAYGVRLHDMYVSKSHLDEIVEMSLKKAGLWNEVKDDLNSSGMSLSGGQQQRLCIARAIAINPDIVLMDEPCSALDPIATSKIEELIDELKQNYTIIMVTHSMQQAARISDMTAFFHNGKLVEYKSADILFTNPSESLTQDYITNRMD